MSAVLCCSNAAVEPSEQRKRRSCRTTNMSGRHNVTQTAATASTTVSTSSERPFCIGPPSGTLRYQNISTYLSQHSSSVGFSLYKKIATCSGTEVSFRIMSDYKTAQIQYITNSNFAKKKIPRNKNKIKKNTSRILLLSRLRKCLTFE